MISASGGLSVTIPALDISRAVPTSYEISPTTLVAACLLRIRWGISGRHETSNDLMYLPPSFYTGSGCIQNLAFNEVYPSAPISPDKEQKSNGFKIDNGFVIPIDKTNHPLSFSMTCLLRIPWGITGTINVWKLRESIQPSGSKAFNGESDSDRGISPVSANSYSYGQISFSSSRVVPVSKENIIASYQVTCLMRILWGIRGLLHGTLFLSPFEGGEGAFFRTAPYESYFSGIGNGSSKFIPREVLFDTSGSIPITTENLPLLISVETLLRIRWGISGSTTLSLYGEYSVGSKNEGALTTALGGSKRNDGAWRDDGSQA